MIIDIHSHILPGLDDGSYNMDMSMEMLDMYAEQGVSHIVTTPHSWMIDTDPKRAWKQFQAFRKCAAERHPDIRIAMGCEVLFDENYRETCGKIKDKILPTLNGTEYVLTEFVPLASKEHVSAVLALLRSMGYKPIIAHAERIRHCFSDVAYANKVVDGGALLQVNAFSFGSQCQLDTKEIACRLLDYNLVHMIGSDAHRMDHRPPCVTEGVEYVRSHTPFCCGILYANAKHLLRL